MNRMYALMVVGAMAVQVTTDPSSYFTTSPEETDRLLKARDEELGVKLDNMKVWWANAFAGQHGLDMNSIDSQYRQWLNYSNSNGTSLNDFTGFIDFVESSPACMTYLRFQCGNNERLLENNYYQTRLFTHKKEISIEAMAKDICSAKNAVYKKLIWRGRLGRKSDDLLKRIALFASKDEIAVRIIVWALKRCETDRLELLYTGLFLSLLFRHMEMVCLPSLTAFDFVHKRMPFSNLNSFSWFCMGCVCNTSVGLGDCIGLTGIPINKKDMLMAILAEKNHNRTKNDILGKLMSGTVDEETLEAEYCFFMRVAKETVKPTDSAGILTQVFRVVAFYDDRMDDLEMYGGLLSEKRVDAIRIRGKRFLQVHVGGSLRVFRVLEAYASKVDHK